MFAWLKRLFNSHHALSEVMHSPIKKAMEKAIERGPYPTCGGCGERVAHLQLVHDKKGNHGYLCSTCSTKYKHLFDSDSIRNFWMCGVCGYRVLAGTQIDATVDNQGNPCPNCGTNVNISLVNLSNDRPIKSGIIGEPLE